MSDPDVEIVRRLFRTVEERDLETMFELYDPQVVIREAASLPYGGEYHGHEGVVEHGLGYLGTWQPVQQPGDETLEPEFIDGGDRVFVRWHQKATAPDGEQVDLPAISEYCVRDGKIVSSAMHHFDTAAILGFLERAAGSSEPRFSEAGERARTRVDP